MEIGRNTFDILASTDTSLVQDEYDVLFALNDKECIHLGDAGSDSILASDSSETCDDSVA